MSSDFLLTQLSQDNGAVARSNVSSALSMLESLLVVSFGAVVQSFWSSLN